MQTGNARAFKVLFAGALIGAGTVLLRRSRGPERYTGVKFKKSITIDRSAEDLYTVWRSLQDLPRFVEGLHSVEVLDERRSKWKLAGPGGYRVEWDAEITTDRRNEMIGWRSSPDSGVETAGYIRFEPAPGNRGTIVRVALEYNPPAGRGGAAISWAFGKGPASLVEESLRRFKQVMETGERTTSASATGAGSSDLPQVRPA